MDFFSRQQLIQEWKQGPLSQGRVLVAGRGWEGCATVWALTGLGVGEILWLGPPEQATERFARFLVDNLSPGLGVEISEYSFAPIHSSDLTWVLLERPPNLVLSSGGSRLQDLLHLNCTSNRIPHLRLSSGRECLPSGLLAAALAVDQAAASLGALPPTNFENGSFSLSVPSVPKALVAIVGVGAVGTYAAAALAERGIDLLLIDFDSVESSNLNRQGFFSAIDVSRGSFKSVAAASRIRELFPEATVEAKVGRVTRGSRSVFESPCAAIVSCVDNAESRLSIGTSLGLPVIQAGTDIFSADCYVQVPGSPLLDEQMYGALTRAAAAEAVRSNRCSADPAYVVPGMVAGALAASRTLDLLAKRTAPCSIHWRRGTVPCQRVPTHHELSWPSR